MTCVSPREIQVREMAKANWDYWCALDDQRQAREKTERRNKDIKTMADLKSEWDKPETTPTRRGVILRSYTALYKKYVPDITEAKMLAYWQDERRKQALARIYGATA